MNVWQSRSHGWTNWKWYNDWLRSEDHRLGFSKLLRIHLPLVCSVWKSASFPYFTIANTLLLLYVFVCEFWSALYLFITIIMVMHLFKKRRKKTINMVMLRTGIQCVQWAFSSNDSHFFFALITGGVQESESRLWVRVRLTNGKKERRRFELTSIQIVM